MIKVGLVTGWNDRCGISQYAQNLFHALPLVVSDEAIQMQIVDCSFAQAVSYGKCNEFDIVQLNESGFTMGGFEERFVYQLKAAGKKTLLTFHASNTENNLNPFTQLFDKVVIHERNTTDGFHYIPQACPVYGDRDREGALRLSVGTSGFPLPHKNLDRLACAAKNVGLVMHAIAPDSQHADAKSVFENIRRGIDAAIIVNNGWLTNTEILDNLNSNLMVCYPYTNHTPGPSAAAMWGLASGRPLIVSRCNQFKHLFDHEDKVYFIDSADPSVKDIERVLLQVRVDVKNNTVRNTDALYEEFNWNKVAGHYVDLYKGMMA